MKFFILFFFLFSINLFAEQIYVPAAIHGSDDWSIFVKYNVPATGTYSVTWVSGLWSASNYAPNRSDCLGWLNGVSGGQWWVLDGVSDHYGEFTANAGDVIGFWVGGAAPVSGGSTYDIQPIDVVSDLQINPPLTATAVEGRFFQYTVTASGGTSPYIFNANNLPPGLAFWVSPDNSIEGIPPIGSAGVYNVDLIVNDSASPFNYDTKTLVITINPFNDEDGDGVEDGGGVDEDDSWNTGMSCLDDLLNKLAPELNSFHPSGSDAPSFDFSSVGLDFYFDFSSYPDLMQACFLIRAATKIMFIAVFVTVVIKSLARW